MHARATYVFPSCTGVPSEDREPASRASAVVADSRAVSHSTSNAAVSVTATLARPSMAAYQVNDQQIEPQT